MVIKNIFTHATALFIYLFPLCPVRTHHKLFPRVGVATRSGSFISIREGSRQEDCLFEDRFPISDYG